MAYTCWLYVGYIWPMSLLWMDYPRIRWSWGPERSPGALVSHRDPSGYHRPQQVERPRGPRGCHGAAFCSMENHGKSWKIVKVKVFQILQSMKYVTNIYPLVN